MNETDAAKPANGNIIEFAGFWRRLLAAIVDTLILGLVGSVIGFAFYDQLIAIGQFGRVIGFPIAFLYFGLLNSRLSGGGTLGKHALGIRVVARSGENIGIIRSLWRSLAYLLPFYLNGFDLSSIPLQQWQVIIVSAIVTFLVFGVIGATVYLYLANWKTRQVVHDLASGTFVVRARTAGQPILRRIRTAHLIVVGLWLLICIAAVPVGMRFVGPKWQSWLGSEFGGNFAAMQSIQSALNADPRILSTGVNLNTTNFSGPGGTTTTTDLRVTITLRGKTQTPERIANDIAARVLKLYPNILGAQNLTVVVRYGFDIGITSSWQSYAYSHSLSEWKKHSEPPSATESA